MRFVHLEADSRDRVFLECVYSGNRVVIEGLTPTLFDQPLMANRSLAIGLVHMLFKEQIPMNIEHLVPKAVLRQNGFEPGSAAFVDLFHLAPTAESRNRDRDTLVFGTREREFEPPDGFKGPVARAVLYMLARYGAHFEGQNYGVLARWHRDNPPEDREIGRAERITALQGNRNPFVDFHSATVAELAKEETLRAPVDIALHLRRGEEAFVAANVPGAHWEKAAGAQRKRAARERMRSRRKG